MLGRRWAYLNDLDDVCNDFVTDTLFVTFIWNTLMRTPEQEIPYQDMESEWDKEGHGIYYGKLRTFLQKYCSMGMITLSPNEEDPKRILRNPAGPDTDVLHYTWDIRRKQPEAELLKIVSRRCVVYGFWFCIPFYMFLQREPYEPYDLIHR